MEKVKKILAKFTVESQPSGRIAPKVARDIAVCVKDIVSLDCARDTQAIAGATVPSFSFPFTNEFYF
jgi:hypothetical protein